VENSLQKVTLFAFNDFHRRLEPFPDGSGGAARLVGKLRQLKAEHPHSLTVNVGDVAGDNKKLGPHSFEPIADLFDRAQVDVLGLGNHEFEDPTDNYASLRRGLIQPFDGQVLCANVSAEGKPVEGTQAYTIKQLAGFNIALIGVVTRDLGSKMHPAAGAGLNTVNIEDTLAQLVPELDRQSDAVVVLGHDNFRNMTEHTRDTPGVDVTLAAHDHKNAAVVVERPDGSKGYVSEAGAYGQGINQIDLYFARDTRQLVKVEVVHHRVDETAPEDGPALEIVRHAPKFEPAEKPPEKSRDKEIRLGSFAELSSWFTTKQESSSK
jgi:5'-nucleotidase